MEPDECFICGGGAQVHVDERRNIHVICRSCGGFIATEGFRERFLALEEGIRSRFAVWMMSNRDSSNRFLFKTKPQKDNPYSAKAGFTMLSVARVQSGHY